MTRLSFPFPVEIVRHQVDEVQVTGCICYYYFILSYVFLSRDFYVYLILYFFVSFHFRYLIYWQDEILYFFIRRMYYFYVRSSAYVIRINLRSIDKNKWFEKDALNLNKNNYELEEKLFPMIKIR